MSTHALKFTPSIHTRPTPSINPSKVRLSPGFTVLVLGASRGIGASIATSYAVARASTVIVAARSASSVEGTAQECKNLCPGIRIEKEACDVSSAESVEALAVRLKEKIGSLDVLVMNSGVFGPMIPRMTEGKAEDFKMAIDTNALGTYYAAHYLVPLLLAKGDRGKAFVVVNTAGTWVTEGIIANPGYCVSKFAQMRIVEILGKQLEDEGLLAVAVHPGAVETESEYHCPSSLFLSEPYNELCNETEAGLLVKDAVQLVSLC